MNKIRQGDQVVILVGKDKGQRGTVLKLLGQRVLVENINVVKRHTKGNPQTGRQNGILDKEMPVHISNVALYNPGTKKADKVGFRFLGDGKKVRYFKSNNEIIDV